MQIWALLVDSYRLLLSRKLFWITLAFSLLVVVFYASIGFNDDGWFVFFGLTQIPDPEIRRGTDAAEQFYLWIFTEAIVGYWFTWIATILALVSTASIYTDLMSDGAIDLVVSKPISRVTIFLAKYVGSLLFVAIQIGLFSLGVFLCVGVRAESWNPKIFLAIPIVLLFFSYLYCVHVCLSIITRSTLAALLITFALWAGLGVMQTAERTLGQLKVTERMAAKFADRGGMQVSPFEPNARPPEPDEAKKTGPPSPKDLAEKEERRRAELERRRQSHVERADEFELWQGRVRLALAVFPKTKDTVALLQKWIVFDDGYSSPQTRGNDQMREMQEELQREIVDRSTGYTLGTSLAFETVVLAFACFLFYRRDF